MTSGALHLQTSGAAVSPRRVLWNVAEPGDPYDIRKSMIGKLPGTGQHPMNEHLEVVCLLQAAEIERISEYLQDYQLKYREFQRDHLDRRSYEVQIRQLTEKAIHSEGVAAENAKLLRFTQSQSEEISELKERLRGDEGQQLQQAESRIAQLRSETEQARRSYEEAVGELRVLRGQLQAQERARALEIEEVKRSVSAQERVNLEASLSVARSQGEAELTRVTGELQRLRVISESREAQLAEANSRNEALLKELQKKEKGSVGKLSEYEGRLAILSQELERVHLSVQQESSRNQELTLSNQRLSRQLAETSHRLKESEGRVATADNEVRRLGHLLREHQSNSSGQAVAQGEVQELLGEVERLRVRMSEVEQVDRRRQAEMSSQARSYESSLGSLRREKEDLLAQLRQYSADTGHNQHQSHRLADLQRTLEQIQGKVSQLQGQRQRMASALTEKDREIQSLVSHVRQLEGTAKQGELNTTRLVANLEQSLQSLQGENHHLRQALNRVTEQSNQKVFEVANLNNSLNSLQLHKAQLENRVRALTEEAGVREENWARRSKEWEGQLGRQDEGIRVQNLVNENSALRRELNEVSRSMKTNEVNFARASKESQASQARVKEKEAVIAGLSAELDTLRRLQTEREASSVQPSEESSLRHIQYEQGRQGLIQENSDLRRTISELEARSINLGTEVDRLGTVVGQLTHERERLAGELGQKERAVAEMQRQNEGMVGNLNSLLPDNESLKQQVRNYEVSIEAYEREVNKRFNVYEESIASLARENEKNHRLLRSKEEELEQALRNYQALAKQFDAQPDPTAVQAGSPGLLSLQQEAMELQRRLSQSERAVLQLQQEQQRQETAQQLRATSLQDEVVRLTEALERKHGDILVVERRLEEVSRERTVSERTMSPARGEGESEQRVALLENKVAVMDQELMRLRQVVGLREEELGQTKGQLSAQLVENSSQARQYSQVSQQHLQAIQRLTEERNRLQGELVQRENEVIELQGQLSTGQEELERVQRAKMNPPQVNLELKDEETRQRIITYEQTVTILTAENANLLQGQHELEAKIALYAQDLERREQLQRQLEGQVLTLREEVRTSQGARQEHSKPQPLTENVQTSSTDLKKVDMVGRRGVSRDHTAVRKHADDYEKGIAKLYGQFARLQRVIDELRAERERLLKKNQALGEEVERLRAANGELEGQSREVRMRFAEEGQLERQVGDQMGLAVALFAEIESLRRQLDEKERRALPR